MRNLILIAALALAGCGTSVTDRTLSGGAIGAGTVDGIIFGGALAGGAVLPGIGIIPGAVLGAALGGALGAVSTPQTLNLGKPVWR